MPYVYYSDELNHYGVLGQKWGIRRYQNYDGTYTQAGLKRYNKSKEAYEKRRSEYKAIKKDRSSSSYDKKYAKAKMVEAKRQMNKDYKHLALDKKGDEGKVLYAQGKRITNNRNTTAMIAKLGATASIGAQYAKMYGYIDTKTARTIQAASVGMTVISGLKGLLDEIPNNKLRAYYSHTSKY